MLSIQWKVIRVLDLRHKEFKGEKSEKASWRKWLLG